MCMAPASAVQFVTLFPPKASEPAALLQARLADFLAHGMSGVVVWSAGHVFQEDGNISPFGNNLSQAMQSVQKVQPHFAGAELQRSSVWLLESQASVRAHWMLDSWQDGKTWIRRFSSYEKEHSTSLASRHSWLRLLEDLGLQGRLVSDVDLAVQLAKQPPKVLVLPAVIALSDNSAAAITAYVKAGGVVVADHGLGIYDEDLRLRTEPALDSLFGIRKRQVHRQQMLVSQGKADAAGRLPSGLAAAERAVQAELAEPVQQFQIQIEGKLGKGRAFYLNLAVCEYAGMRLLQEQAKATLDLRRRLRWILAGAGVTPGVELRAPGMPTCLERLFLRAKDGRQLLALRVNALSDPELLQQLSVKGARPVFLRFKRPHKLTDLRTGQHYAAAAKHELQLDIWQGLFLQVEAVD